MLEFADAHSFLTLMIILCGTCAVLTALHVLKEITLRVLALPRNLLQWSNIQTRGWPPGTSPELSSGDDCEVGCEVEDEDPLDEPEEEAFKISVKEKYDA